MLKVTFKDLIARNNTTISKIHEATSISRSTLTLLANGESKGIQFDTLEKLCLYLNSTPNDLFKILPDDFATIIESNPVKLTEEDPKANVYFSWFTFQDYNFDNTSLLKQSNDYFFITILGDLPTANGMLYITVKVPENKGTYKSQFMESKSFDETVAFFEKFDDDFLTRFARKIAANILKNKFQNKKDNLSKCIVYLKLDPKKNVYQTLLFDIDKSHSDYIIK